MTVAFIQNHNRVKAISFSAMLPVCEDSLRGQFIFSFLRRDGQGAIATKKI